MSFGAFLPGLLWLAYFYAQDKYEPEPKRMVLKCFLTGALCSVVAGGLEQATTRLLPWTDTGIADLVAMAAIEEVVKCLTMILVVFRSRELNERLDGMVYAASVALGFASLENLGYMWAAGNAVLFARSWLSTLAHPLFSIFWGFALARIKLESRSWGTLFSALAMATALHALFNSLAGMSRLPFASALLLLLMFGLWRMVMREIRAAGQVSPFKHPLPIRCALCDRSYPSDRHECPHCGHITHNRL